MEYLTKFFDALLDGKGNRILQEETIYISLGGIGSGATIYQLIARVGSIG
jgi:hypothetical protein